MMLPPDVWRSAMPAGGCREWLSALTSSVITGAVVAAKVRRHGLAGEHGRRDYRHWRQQSNVTVHREDVDNNSSGSG